MLNCFLSRLKSGCSARSRREQRRRTAAAYRITEPLEVRQLLTTLFDDLAAASGGDYAVSGSTWEAAVFTTDNSSYTNLTASLLMFQSDSGSLLLDLYSDGDLKPESLLGTFAPPSSIGSTLSVTDFSLSDVTLAANTNYWLVLHASVGTFNWGWTSDFTIMSDWAESTDSGSTWYSDNAYPFQYRVVGTTGSETPSVSIADASTTEGNSATTTLTFTATLSSASSSTVTVAWATAADTASAGTDYTTASGTLSFAAGVTSQTFDVTIAGDTTVESDETLFVNLSSPANAAISDAQAVGTITNDDVAVSAPTITGPAAATESSTPTITWTSVSGASGYRVWISNLSTGTSPLIDAAVESTSYVPTSLGIGVYRVWVRAKFPDSSITGWSSPHDFHVNTRVTLAGITTPSKNGLPTLTWTALAGAVKYDVWVNNKSTSTSQVLRDQNVTGSSYTVTEALPLGQFIFWVRGIDAGDVAGQWSIGIFTTVVIAPSITSPSDSTLDTTPIISWTALNGAAAYDLWMAPSGSSTATIRQKALTLTSYTVPSTLASGSWNAWVRGIAANSFSGAWSAVRTFNIGGGPTVISPTASSTVGVRPTFTWTSVDASDHYEIWVNRLDTFVTKYLYSNSVSSVNYTPSTNMAAGSYRVWIRAIAADGSLSAWSTGVTFSVA